MRKAEKKNLNLSEHLSFMAERFPSKPALLYPARITYQELQDEVNKYAFGLERVGITRNTRTILMIPPGPEFIIMTFALLRIGAILVMIDPGMGAKAMANALAGVEADAFIGIPKAHLLKKFYPHAFKTVKISVTLGRRWFWGGYRLPDLRSNKKQHYPAVRTQPEDMVAIFFTSGSTGPPKGVVFTAAMLNSQIRYLASDFNYNPKEIDLCTFPLLGLFSICLGLTLVLADMDSVRPATLNPKQIIANIQQNGCTQMFCSPMVLNRLARYGQETKIKLPSLKRIITAAAPASKELLESFKKLLAPDAEIHTPYGATEALPVTNMTASELLQHSSRNVENEEGICVGRPLDGIDVKIIEISDDPISFWKDAQQLLIDEVGEIVVKGPVVSREYLNLPHANANAKIKNQKNGDVWHRMGDVGRLDKDGKLWFYGRKSHRVVTPEQTLFTIPCEAVFNQHPHVFRSALVGIPDGVTNQEKSVLCVQLDPGYSGYDKKIIIQELLELGATNHLTKNIRDILFPKYFPVDARHNAKIQREKLALWAKRRIK
jgi:acyl-CoA synthetase (AMP-forming)/AMP-acid ligase II